MPVYLIRHAHAGSRSQWQGDDGQRPLSAKGRKQAEAISARLSSADVERVVSSPATRCVETVQGLAESHGLTVEVDGRFGEGGDVEVAIDALFSPPIDGTVLCSHGDLIPKIMRRLLAEGLRTTDPNLSQKGSMWALDIEDGRLVSGTYYPPDRA